MLSANKIYRESGSSLPFKDWLEREKNKGVFIPNAQALKEFNNFDGESTEEKIVAKPNDTIMRNVIIVIGIGLTVALFYKYSKS